MARHVRYFLGGRGVAGGVKSNWRLEIGIILFYELLVEIQCKERQNTVGATFWVGGGLRRRLALKMMYGKFNV